jgi:hypothetical protein
MSMGGGRLTEYLIKRYHPVHIASARAATKGESPGGTCPAERSSVGALPCTFNEGLVYGLVYRSACALHLARAPRRIGACNRTTEVRSPGRLATQVVEPKPPSPGKDKFQFGESQSRALRILRVARRGRDFGERQLRFPGRPRFWPARHKDPAIASRDEGCIIM